MRLEADVGVGAGWITWVVLGQPFERPSLWPRARDKEHSYDLRFCYENSTPTSWLVEGRSNFQPLVVCIGSSVIDTCHLGFLETYSNAHAGAQGSHIWSCTVECKLNLCSIGSSYIV